MGKGTAGHHTHEGASRASHAAPARSRKRHVVAGVAVIAAALLAAAVAIWTRAAASPEDAPAAEEEPAEVVSDDMGVAEGSDDGAEEDADADDAEGDEVVSATTESGISYIPEDRHNTALYLDFTLGENLAIRRYYKEPFSKKGILNFDEFNKNADEQIQRYDIRSGQGRKTVVRSMSGGNQQKAIVGREIEEHSDLMIFVQPTRGMDIGAIENIHRQILAERDRGAAILLISLELDEIMELADTIGVIYNGQMLKIAPASTLTSLDVGRYMMGVKDA